MTTKIVVRLLDAEGALLASCVHDAAVRGDGCLRAASPVVCGVAQSGTPATISVHWCDVNVEVRTAAALGPLEAGQVLTLFDTGAELVRVGPMPGPLPPIVVGAVAVGVPVGGMGAR